MITSFFLFVNISHLCCEVYTNVVSLRENFQESVLDYLRLLIQRECFGICVPRISREENISHLHFMIAFRSVEIRNYEETISKLLPFNMRRLCVRKTLGCDQISNFQLF